MIKALAQIASAFHTFAATVRAILHSAVIVCIVWALPGYIIWKAFVK